jgi:hypothetical protein
LPRGPTHSASQESANALNAAIETLSAVDGLTETKTRPGLAKNSEMAVQTTLANPERMTL